MSDVSKTNSRMSDVRLAIMETLNDPIMKLVLERNQHAWSAGLAMKLCNETLATRVPVQGEPNDDRETVDEEQVVASVLAELEEHRATGDTGGWGTAFHRHGLSNEVHRDMDDCGQGTGKPVYVFDPDYLAEHDEWVVQATLRALSRATVPDAAVAEGDQIIDQAMKRVEVAEAERDAAVAAIERVRELHRKETRRSGWEVCTHCEVGMLQDPVDWPCDTIAAIDTGKDSNDDG